MTINLLLPELDEFEMPNVLYKVVNPSALPEPTLKAFNNFMSGSAVPHHIYVYAHDYSRFCMLVHRGSLTITLTV